MASKQPTRRFTQEHTKQTLHAWILDAGGHGQILVANHQFCPALGDVHLNRIMPVERNAKYGIHATLQCRQGEKFSIGAGFF